MKHFRIPFSAIALAALLFFPLHTFASATLGTIDPRNVGNFKALLENSSISAPPGEINFGKFTTESSKNITVSSTELRGFAWGEGVGWIVVNCADTTSGCSSANSNFKVANDGSGNLSGYAWGEQTGWINFGPFLNPLVSTVKITNGLFGGTLGSAGYAWSQNFGWIKFDCSNSNSCVETDWRATSSSGGGGGGPSGGGPVICPAGEVVSPTTGQCVIVAICPNTTDYSAVPLLSRGQSVSATIPSTGSIGFAIQTFDSLDPLHPAGTFTTQDTLNGSHDQVAVYAPLTNSYILGFEDLINGDYDYNDLVAGVSMTCAFQSQPCLTPNTLGDTTTNAVHNSPGGEPNLQTILNTTGYSLNITNDQKQYQVWDATNNGTVTITAKFIGRYAAHNDVFGYYTNGSLSTFVPLFKTANVGSQPTTSVPASCTIGSCSGGQVLNTLGQCVDYCSFYPSDPDCVAAAFCAAHPTDPACVITPPAFCTVHPTDPTCTQQRDFCTANPTDPACVVVVPPFCAQHPTDPTCTQQRDFCTANPTDPSCTVTPASFCTVHPTDPTCTQQRDFCVTHPDDIACKGGGGTGIDCAANPKNPLCLILPPVKKIPIINNFLLKLTTALGVFLPVASSIASYLFGNPLTWGDLPLVVSRGWGSLLVAIGLNKRKNPWGVVYDSRTKRPIDPAYVVLTDMSGNEVSTAITDIDGRYGFAVDPGTYKIFVNKSNYSFPSSKVAGKKTDSLYDNLYFGEEITINKEGEIITKNIPLDQSAFDWNEYAKTQPGGTYGQKLHFYHTADIVLYRLSRIVFWLGFAFAAYAVIFSPSVWNGVVLGLYGSFTILRATTPLFHKKGSVVLRSDGSPLPFSVVRLVSNATNTEVAHKVADRLGTYYGLVQNGTYHINIDTKTQEESYDRHSLANPVKVKKGYLKKKFEL